MTCPFCGAKQIFSGKFECGTINGMRSPACYESEIEKLRDKKAEGLKWEDSFFYSSAKSFGGLRFALERCNAFQDSWFVCGNDKLQFQSRDAAKAHAEELHQQEWREMRERWDYKGGGK